jgi:hypothetical protein
MLLEKDVTKRLGCLKGGARDVKEHPFFAGEFRERCSATSLSPLRCS